MLATSFNSSARHQWINEPTRNVKSTDVTYNENEFALSCALSLQNSSVVLRSSTSTLTKMLERYCVIRWHAMLVADSNSSLPNSLFSSSRFFVHFHFFIFYLFYNIVLLPFSLWHPRGEAVISIVTWWSESQECFSTERLKARSFLSLSLSAVSENCRILFYLWLSFFTSLHSILYYLSF